jgi:hypothetical protein
MFFYLASLFLFVALVGTKFAWLSWTAFIVGFAYAFWFDIRARLAGTLMPTPSVRTSFASLGQIPAGVWLKLGGGMAVWLFLLWAVLHLAVRVRALL